ncbi:urease accessory protein UreE [Sinorhizobium sp. CCBAU 05631]|uniref:urease accessory protein UreE n=1 Tax=Sinorhizobium sp. CCBAU 05631 TaxID=794846 RepID=UPI0004B75682|nr:urease accessory protein UreE [Sinorhizobium sp. CCBAU 05631]ASY57535.1 Urease accessory protein UreE [Sinorhizobium sp. CCBAU 05631]
MPYRSTEILSPGAADKAPLHQVTLTHDQRHLRRKLLHLENEDVVMLDLKEPVMLADGDLLVLEGGGYIEVKAAEEALYEILPRDRLHLVELAWHLGNRHLPAAIEEGRILIARDPVIRAMLEGLGATVSEVVEPFQPLRGAYHGTGHHHHGHGHHHDHG